MLYEDAKAIATGMKQDTSVPGSIVQAGALASGRERPYQSNRYLGFDHIRA
ncbi:MAG: hypothetical protein IPI42_06730 [Saprospiraceae bacterium]|nr:hypothetical protein [Candidatus Parvibacillus calidus]